MSLLSRFWERTALVLGFTVLLNPVVSYGQSQSGSLTGEIKSAKGESLEGVSIKLRNSSRGTTSNEKGYFKIDKLSAGEHTVDIQYLGYSSQVKKITLEPGQNKSMTVEMKDQFVAMDQVVFNSKSTTRKINEKSFNVEAVDASKFHNSSSNAEDLLDRLSGVRILQNGGVGSDFDFSLNGFTGDQVKFFLNGIPMDNYGSSFNLSAIPVNSIKRVEVYKGVVPVSLGTDALGGAVNIITTQDTEFLDASYSVGSFNTHRASINSAYTDSETGFTVKGNLNYNYSDNDYDVLVDVDQDALGNEQERKEVSRFHDRYRSATAKVEAGFVNRSFADRLLLGAIISGDDDQVQNGATMASVYGGVVSESRSNIATLKYKKDDIFTEGLDLNLNASYNHSKNKNIDTVVGARYNWAGERLTLAEENLAELGKPSDESLTNDEVNSQLNIGYSFDEHHSISINHAFQYFHRKTFDKRDPDKLTNQFPSSLYKNILGLSYKYEHNDKWSTTLFGKAYFLKSKSSKEFEDSAESRDNYTVSNTNYGYGMATSYFLLPKLQLKASFEHTYRLPKPDELFGNGLFTLPNPDLDPEQSDNLNLGATYRWRLNQDHRFKLGGSFIYRNAEDLIFQVVNVGSPETTFSNLSKVRTTGVEGNLNYQYQNWLTFDANVTYQDIRDRADQVYSDYAGYQKNYNKGERVPNRPYFFGNASLGYKTKDFILEGSQLNINYYFNYVKEYYLSWAGLGERSSKAVIPEQTSHDLEFIYSLQNGKYNIALTVENVTDNRLYDKFYLEKPGRAFYLKFRYKL